MSEHDLRVAAIQMEPILGDVDGNLETVRQLTTEASRKGAEWIVLPEFFTTGMTFDDRVFDGVRDLDGDPLAVLKELAARLEVNIGGAFLARSKGHVRNTFVLVGVDGGVQTHDKDFPSGPIEHACYLGGEDEAFVSLLSSRGIDVTTPPVPSRRNNEIDGTFTINDLSIGMAQCWEMIRSRTVNRLADKVDFLLTSSAWGCVAPEKR